MDRYYNDKGEVAVLVSPGYGAGWSTWMSDDKSVFDPEIAKAIDEKKSYEEILEIAKKNYPKEYFGGLEDVVIRWLPKGTQFMIDEYDGSEGLRTVEDLVYTA